MAFTRGKLKGYGLTDEQITAVMEDHVEVVDALKNERDRYKESAEKYDEAQKELDGIKKDGWQKKYEDEHKAFEDFKKSVEGKEAHAAKETAYRDALTEAGIPEKWMKRAMSGVDFDALELADGKLKNAADVVKSIRDEWADVIPTTTQQGAKTSNPPAGTSGKMSKADILAIKDPAERQNAIAENHELFGI